MKSGELVQIEWEGASANGEGVAYSRAVGFVSGLGTSYVTLQQTQAAGDPDHSTNLISIPLSAITASNLLNLGRRRSLATRKTRVVKGVHMVATKPKNGRRKVSGKGKSLKHRKPPTTTKATEASA